MFKRMDRWVSFVFAFLLLASARLGFGAFPAPPLPDKPFPADTETSASVNTLLQWQSHPANPAPSPVAAPKVLVFEGHTYKTMLNNTIAGIQSHFTNFSTTITSDTTPSALAGLLADKQVLIITDQIFWTDAEMSAFGSSIGVVLRQFADSGGLIVVCDAANGFGARFLANAGLMNVSFNHNEGDRILKPVAVHPLTQNVSTTFTALYFNATYNSVGDAQVVIADEATNRPVVAVKPIGAGNVVLLGWDFLEYTSDMALVLANAVRSLSLSNGTDFIWRDVYFSATNPPDMIIAQNTYSNQCSPEPLLHNTYYYWRVVERNATGTTVGPIWSFQTPPLPSPAVPSSPQPINGAIGANRDQQLSWNPGGVPAEFTVWLDTVNPPAHIYNSGLSQPKISVPGLSNNTTYYWRVVSGNLSGETEGPVWSFTTPTTPPVPNSPFPADGATSVSVKMLVEWNTAPGPAASPIATPKALVFCPSAQYEPLAKAALDVFRTRFPNFTTQMTSTTSASVLLSQLADKQVLVMSVQPSIPTALTLSIGPIVRQFAKSGGLVICIDTGSYPTFLSRNRMMDVTYKGWSEDLPVVRVSNHPIMQDFPASADFYGRNIIYNESGNAEALLRETYANRPNSLIRQLGDGHVLLIGSTYSDYTNTMGIIPGNAIQELSFSRGMNPTTYDVYLDTVNPPLKKYATASYADWCSTGTLKYETVYYWKVVAHTAAGDAAGPVWSFRTGDPPPPQQPLPLSPSYNTTLTTTRPFLSWNPGTIPATYSVRLDTVNPPVAQVATGLTQPQFIPPRLAGGRTYYWQVISHNISGDTAGPIWPFITPPSPLASSNVSPADGATSISRTTRLRWGRTSPVTTSTVQIAVFSAHAVGGAQWSNISAAIQARVPRFNIDHIVTDDTPTLAARLDTKHVLIVPEQYSTPYWDLCKYGKATGPILRKFVEDGGLIIMPTGSSYGVDDFLTSASLMNVRNWSSVYNRMLERVSNHPILAGTSAFTSRSDTCSFKVLDDSVVLFREQVWGNPVAAFRSIGAGNVLKLGWNYAVTSYDMDIILTNAINMLGKPGNEHYDVYFGTSNPPASLLQTTNSLSVSPGTLNFSTTYFWKVVARGAGGDAPGAVWSFRTGAAPIPGVPSNPTPPANQLNVNPTTKLQWSAAANATSYDVYFGTTTPPTTKIVDHGAATECAPPLNYATTYFWRVVAHNAYASTNGPVWGFRTMNLPKPAAPSNPSPADGALNVATNAILTWAAGSIPATFTVKFGTTNPPTTVIASGLSQPVCNPGALQLSKTYYWQVTATNASGSTAGPVWSFSTPPAPGAPSNPTPAANALNVNPRTKLQWSAAANATNYDVYFGTTNPPTALIVDHGADTQCTATLAYATTYYWRVVARNSYGETSGAVWSFRTMNLPKPDAPSNPLPENNAVYVPTTTTLAWNPGSVPATYSVKLGMSNPPFIEIATGLTEPSFKPMGLGPASTYYWQVIATNAAGTTAGPVWKFTTVGPPFVPGNPSPANGAKKVPLNAKLTWSGIPELPVNILAFTGHSDNSPTGEYQKTLAAIRMHFTNFTVTETTSENPATIAALLAGKQVFLVPEQENWNINSMAGFGSALQTTLQNFRNAGGLVIVCDSPPTGGGGWFMYSALGMPFTGTTHVGQTTAKVGPADACAVTQGVETSFASYGTLTYSMLYGWCLVRQAGTNNGIVVMDPFNGYGASILFGWDFDQYNDNMALVIANAIRFYGGASRANETYDIYFGTSNPPMARIAVGIACAPMAPPAMAYARNYYWYVVAKNSRGTKTGPTWSFTTTGKTAIPRTDWSYYE